MNDSAAASSIRTFLLVQNRLLREALARVFRKMPDFAVPGQAAPSKELPAELINSECDVVVADCFVANLTPADAGGRGGASAPKILLVDMDADEERFLTAVRCGVKGYLLKDVRASDVIAAVRAVSRGEAVCSPQLCAVLFGLVMQASREMPGQEVARPDLTLRQQQLVGLVARGLTNKEIATKLNLSEFTVRNHIHRIMKQVDAESRGQAVEHVRAHGYAISA